MRWKMEWDIARDGDDARVGEEMEMRVSEEEEEKKNALIATVVLLRYFCFH